LDDYKESAFTPTLTGSGGQSGQSYALQVGNAIKCGRQVTITGAVSLSALGTISGNLGIGGLPFPAQFDSPLTIGWFTGLTVTVSSVSAMIAAGSAAPSLYYVPAAGDNKSSSLTAGQIGSAFTVYFAGTYLTNN
jgi:hypothetical protein